jgi:hypothetical protein
VTVYEWPEERGQGAAGAAVPVGEVEGGTGGVRGGVGVSRGFAAAGAVFVGDEGDIAMGMMVERIMLVFGLGGVEVWCF